MANIQPYVFWETPYTFMNTIGEPADVSEQTGKRDTTG